MKSERRHELQHNTLFDWLNRTVAKIAPYSNAILATILLAGVGLLGWSWWSGRAEARQEQAWTDLFGAVNSGNPANLDDVVERYPGSEVAQWASVVAADMHLEQGCRQLFESKALGAQELQEARDKYLLVLKDARNPQLRERATFGLARAYEALAGTRQSQGELDRASENYQNVVDNWPQGVYIDLARQRLEDLKRADTKQFYDAFAKYEPKPAPPAGAPAGQPVFNPDLLTEPSAGGAAAPAGQTTPGSTIPIEPQTVPAPTASEQPAGTSAPAEPAPATTPAAPAETDSPAMDESGSTAPADESSSAAPSPPAGGEAAPANPAEPSAEPAAEGENTPPAESPQQ